MRFEWVFRVFGLPFQGDSLERHSLGGSETAAICVARELAAMGQGVTVFSPCETPGDYDRVAYRRLDTWQTYAQTAPHDISVVQRQPEIFAGRLNSRLNLLWCHDIALGRNASLIKGAMWNIDRVMVVSKWMAEQYRDVYGLPESVIWTTRNGLDLHRFPTTAVPRDPKKLIYAARPERGVDVLLGGILPKALKRDPALRLYLCGYRNPVEHLTSFYEHVDSLIKQHGDRVVWLGHLTKEQLYQEYLTAGAYVYPTPSPTLTTFREVSCISAMEAMACGLPFIASKAGALPETLGEAGILIDGPPHQEMVQQAFVDAIFQVTSDDALAAQLGAAGRARAKRLSWRDVAKDWVAGAEQLIAERNDSPHRLAYHFIRHSDIMAAKELVAPLDDPQALEIKDRLQKHWGFAETPEGIREQYARIGETHTDVYEYSTREARFHTMVGWLREHPDCRRILDYGCGLGAYAVGGSNAIGREWLGVDIDDRTVEWCEQYKRTRADHPEDLTFRQGDWTVDLSDQKPFDCLIAFEVLEHVTDPTVVIESLERWIRPGGRVLITVPFGPWEYLSYDSYPWRCHLWEFDRHDLLDLFGRKDKVQIHVLPHGACEPLAEPVGWHIVEYVVQPDRPTGTIDMARKLALQRPRQTVSAVIIAGPNAEETIHWCLRSIQHVADEVIIADCGMSDEGLRIARQYPVTIVPGSDPKQAGFETPRNQALAHARMDFVLWPDTDEKLVDPQKIHKYLRQNMFHGYSLKQHHFACDTTFNPDMPVRLFRRGPDADGRAMRWYGMIHEHPELGLNVGPGAVIVISDVHIAHVGYLIESTRQGRFARNYPLLQRDMEVYPERLIQKHFICRDNCMLNTYEFQHNGGKITPEMRARAQEVIDLYRKYFLGKGIYMGADTLQYYTLAVQILQTGVDVAFQVAAAKDTASPNGIIRARFASLEDAEKELGRRIKEIVTPYTLESY